MASTITQASAASHIGRFMLYLRGEFQGAPSAAGYSSTLAQTLASVDGTVDPVTGLAFANQATIPAGPIARLRQGVFSRHISPRKC